LRCPAEFAGPHRICRTAPQGGPARPAGACGFSDKAPAKGNIKTAAGPPRLCGGGRNILTEKVQKTRPVSGEFLKICFARRNGLIFWPGHTKIENIF